VEKAQTAEEVKEEEKPKEVTVEKKEEKKVRISDVKRRATITHK